MQGASDFVILSAECGRRRASLRVLYEDAMAAHGFDAPAVARLDLDEAQAFLGELHGLLKGTVRADLHGLTVDLDPHARIALAADDEDTTVGFDVLEVKRRRIGALVAAAGFERRDA